MHLLLGHPLDECCRSVGAALREHGHRAVIVQNPLIHPAQFSWRLEDRTSTSRLACEGWPTVPDGDISGVLVRGRVWMDPSEWAPEDAAYAQAETQAALLAWLWSLPCPVVNRYSADGWYRPHASLLSWHPLLHAAGLETSPMLVTSDAGSARAFGGPPGAVLNTLTSGSAYLVGTDADWIGVAELQRHTPVWLSRPHGAAQSVCMVGERVVWDGAPPPRARALEEALRRFASAAGLAFVELGLAPVGDRLCAVAVEDQPRLERFGASARHQIVDGLVALLTPDGSRAAGEERQS